MKDYLVFAAVLLVTLLSCAGIALPYPILAPLFMGGQVNGLNAFMGISPELLLGIALAIYPLGIFIGGSFIGALSDVYGRKKLLTSTLLVSIVGYLLSAYAIVTEQYLLFIASRFFTGLCEGNIAIARAIALDLSDKIDKTRAMSLISAATFGGWFVGPLAGGYLAEYGPQIAFEAAAIAILVCLAFVMMVIKDPKQEKVNQSFMTSLRSHNSLTLLANPVIRQIFIFQFCFCLGLNAFYEFYPVWLVMARDFQPSMIGEMTAIMTTFMTLSSVFLVTRLKRRFGIHKTLIAGMLISAIFMVIVPMLTDVAMVVAFALTGVGIALYNGLLPVYASDINKEVGNGALMGLVTVTFCIANAVIAIVGSFALKVSASFPLFLGSGLIILSMILLLRFIYVVEKPALETQVA